MKKLLLMSLTSALLLSSCGTIFQSGKATSYQTAKPVPPQTSRKVKAGALIGDIVLFPPALILDFVNGKIYKKEAK